MTTELEFEQKELNKFEAAFPLHEEVPEYDNHSPQRQGQWQGWLKRAKLGSQGTPPEDFKCKAKKTADPPQDCDWPFCGCDPAAEKVIEAIQESGFVFVKEQAASQGTGWAEGWVAVEALRTHWLNSIECLHIIRSDVSHCACGWKSGVQATVGIAVERWIEHVMEQALPAPPSRKETQK